MPHPRISSQPEFLHTPHPLPPQTKHSISISAEGSVNGKYEARKRVRAFCPNILMGKINQRPFQVSEGDVLAHYESFHLIELNFRARRDLLIAETHAWQRNADRRRIMRISSRQTHASHGSARARYACGARSGYRPAPLAST